MVALVDTRQSWHLATLELVALPLCLVLLSVTKRLQKHLLIIVLGNFYLETKATNQILFVDQTPLK